ncbi:MAG: hypothetical protein PHU71_00885 [Candidatus Gracilibacteria bacterium]|nr:hypothetical protein [Candidatus Gracilibacteria bacterium]
MAGDENKLQNDLSVTEQIAETASENLEHEEELFENSDIEETSGKRPTILLGLLMLSIILLAIGFGYYYAGKVDEQNLEITQLDSQISNLELQIKVEEQRGEKRKAELRDIKQELTSPEHRILWSKVIKEIEDITHNTVVKSDSKAIYNFNGYSLSEQGTIPLSGFTNSYTAIADLIEEFEASDKFTDLRFTSSSKSMTPDGQERASLSLSVKMADNAFSEETPQVNTEVALENIEETV